ncbi:hypothetical protein T552_02466 [Pneumocystis carinii B80]|uniref:Thc1 RRM domain-containing protein n=1 Tax=Pneumocystis carinii (strain B80) TaxID=1408658 RepID=A0A0W4ZF20_PNEC8|nr:hypothetical protein T552_02466 [Pneumocystis carinii B80]KTW26975.1 hypothetical protein T552_02466 [Pneumocystis carinii B80]
MCLRGVNLLENQTSNLPYLINNSLVINSEKKEGTFSRKIRDSSESEVLESWEELLDKQNDESEPSLEGKSLSEGNLQKKGSETLHSLNSENQPTVIANILEISNMPANTCSDDIYKAFDISKDEMTIKWINGTKARLYFPTEEIAIKTYFKYLSSSSSIGTVSPLPPDYRSIHSSTSSAFTSRTKTPLTTFHKNTFLTTLEPSKYIFDERPIKTTTVVKRLITGVLGTRFSHTPKEKAYDQMMIRQFLDTVKENEAFELRKKEIWEKNF